MTNEEKAKQIADAYAAEEARVLIYSDTMKMAQWKDSEFEKEKQQLIDDACEWWKNELTYPTMTQTEIDYIQEKIENFKNAMRNG